MNRKPVTVIFLTLLVLAIALAGCSKDASPELPDEVGMPEEAAGNPTPVLTEEPTAVPTVEPTETPTAEPTEEPTPDPFTPEPTEESTPEPTEEPTMEPTVEPTAAPTEVATPGKHIVQPGENLFRIALRYGTTVSAMAQANGITNVSRIYPGQELVIPGGSGGAPQPTPPPGGEGDVVHVVQPGENLFRIALRYNYDQYYVARYNGISNPALIYPGQEIRIPRK